MKEIANPDAMNEKNSDLIDLDKTNKIYSLDDDLIKSDQKVIIKQNSLIKEVESNKDIKILQNKKSKSNFIWTIFLIPRSISLVF